MRSRPVQAFVGVFCAAGLLYFIPLNVLGLSSLGYWALVLAAAIVAALLARKGAAGGLFTQGSSEFLCDTCRYNNERDCRRPERPNAARCPDYKRR